MTTAARRTWLCLFCALVGCTAFPESLLEKLESSEPVEAGLDAAPATDASTVAARYRDAVRADAPIAYLRFAERDGVTAHDEVQAFDGTYSTSGVLLGQPGPLGAGDTAITLDGTGGITMPAGIEFEGASPFSVEVWFRSDARNTPTGFVVDHERWDSRAGWTLRVGNATNLERWVAGDTGGDGAGELSPPPGEWHHLVGVFTGEMLRVYRDGGLVAEVGSGRRLGTLGTTFSVGRQNCECGSSTAFVGDLDELAIYDKALSAQSVRQHYDAARAP